MITGGYMSMNQVQIRSAYSSYHWLANGKGASPELANALAWLGVVATWYGESYTLNNIRRTEQEQNPLINAGLGVENSTHLTGDGADLEFSSSDNRKGLGAWWEYWGLTWGGNFTRSEPWHFDIRKR